MTILLTGASGYLGQHTLLALLAAGHEVTAYVRDPKRLGALADLPSVRVVAGDLAEPAHVSKTLRSHHAIVHAALIWGAPGTEFDLPDAIAAATLFEAAGQAGVNTCVLVSSTAVHRPFQAVMSESDPLQTADLYGASKATAELMMWAACNRHSMRGVVVRSGPIVGPPAQSGGPFRSNRRLEELVGAAQHNAPLHVTAQSGRQFVAVSDVARVLVTAIHDGRAAGTYLCVSDTVSLWEDIATQVVDLAASSSRIVVKAPQSVHPPYRFDVGRLRGLLGHSLDSQPALAAHIQHLVSRG